MKLVTFSTDGKPTLGIVRDDLVFDLPKLAFCAGQHDAPFSSMIEFLRDEHAFNRVKDLVQNTDLMGTLNPYPLNSVRLQSPVPNPGKIIAVGLNYLDHCTEQGIQPPEVPLLFAKFPNSVTGPYDSIVIPDGNPEVDYEVELGVVIGRRAKRVSEHEALQYVAGYMVLNDVSARKWQFADKQWTRGKSCDTFAPMGPWLTTVDEVPEPENLAVATRVNGQLLQDSSTKNLIFGVAKLISYISESITLEPGDVIATGTPPGVGVFRKPPIYLKPGDLVETEIECLGKLSNPVVVEQRQATAPNV